MYRAVTYIYSVFYSIMSADKGRESDTNIETSGRDLALFIMVINSFSLLVFVLNIVALYRGSHFDRFWFTVAGIPYIFIVRYLLLRMYDVSRVRDRVAAWRYSSMQVSIAGLLIGGFTFIFFMGCVLFVFST